MERKPLVVYYSNCDSVIGEIAHKLALDVKGDIYEVKTTQRIKKLRLKQDGRKTFSKLPVVFDLIDFSPYNEIFIGGEWVGKHLVGPMRQWINQNKTFILRDDIQLIFFGFDKKGSNINKTFQEMVELLGEPYRRLIITPEDYPYHNLSRKIGYHQNASEEDEKYLDNQMTNSDTSLLGKVPINKTGKMRTTPMSDHEQHVRME
ncbi:hypothetical protein EHI8A_081690 [Entamoeba histolytica HM-1:IMSS-B]|uniref:Flavodoxin-like domain-containing protein n=6 Tax=Entamoeba histolytica TaxID=5759 RepID=C4M5N5_ENTH1|nr:hypothetical protein EHI_040580 [Entamoeba histolytica HM-1:IMSS]EMD49561.1 Hypothetical protein EHI5A_103480 [Entamoeba histolytica KU27]EMH76559.1 hypothetical protein EHI8A_081690 [Entamoeba histolytica HM-1:IMSS-B]EMS10880.1 hypothetical protein KM1_129290 [Entamoeba histolytica HM-3:IMSS]ENY61556.1 hypothetical protein EHI7A_068390 [Entamoeba histolytica HM-1:IMSS-A]GAT96746.1 hypothetical protein CL6EHI_040580 [Entamoeba histolytica]|eukprot:XP_651459.1 hypothetical protein EHI_040580 [Entamoeba histolytica HM-1:IMSS]